MKPEILEKIRKCLAMAEHEGSNPNEAATAMRMAQALMRQHGVSEDDLSAAKVVEKQILAARKMRTPWEAAIAALVSSAFGVGRYWSHLNSDAFFSDEPWGSYNYYGDPARVEIAVYAHAVLIRKLQESRKIYLAEQRGGIRKTPAMADSFVIGFLETVSAALTPLIPNAAETRALAEFRHSKRLVQAKGVGSLCQGDSSAHAAGREAGSGISLNVPMNARGPLRAIGG